MNNKGASFSTSSLSSSNSLTIAASVTGAATAAAAAVTQPSTNLNEPIKFLYGHKGPIIRCLSYDGYFVTAGYDQQIIIWDDESAKQKIAITSAHDHIISGLDIHYASGSSYKDAYIVSSSWDKTCKVFHLKDGKLIACFRHHQNRVKCVRAVVDREKVISKVVSGDDDGKIYLWTLLKAEKIYCLEGHSRLIVDLTSYHVSSTETYLASCSLDATIRFWDLLSGELKHVSETTAFKCLNSLLSTSMLPCDQTASVSTLHHNHNVTLGDSSSIGPMHSQYSMGNHHNIFSLPALVPPPPIISNNSSSSSSSSQVMDSASAVCSRIQTMKSPPKLIDTILIAAATAAAADSKDKDTSGSVLIFRSSGPLIGSLLYRVNTSAKVVCLFLNQELGVPYFNQPSSAGSSHYPSSSSVVVAATASGIPSRINTAKGPPVPPPTSQPDHPHLIYILEDAIMGYIDLRTISSLCSSITVDADSLADRGVTTSMKRPQIATTVTHRTTLYLYHDLDGNAVDASSDHHHHSSNGNDNEDMKIMGSMSNAAIERGVGSITTGSLHHKSSGGNLLRSNSSKIVVHPIKETSSLSALMMVNDDDDSNDDDDDGHDSDDDSSIRRRDDASSQALVQEALHQDRVNALDISCCTVSKTLFVRTKMISTNNCYMYILIGRRDGSLRRKIFHSTRRPSRHDIYLMSPDAVTTDLNIVDTMQRSDATTITSNRKGSLNNTNRSITMKDRDKKVVSIPSNNDKGGMKNSHSKATDMKTIIDSVGNNNHVMQHSMHRSNSENVSTLYHNSNSNHNHQLKKKSHSHPGHLLYKATDVDLDDDVDEAMYDPVQKTYVYKSPPSINNDIASSSQQQLPPNDDMRGVVLLSEFDFAKSNDELLSMTSDYEMNANTITDLQSQQSNSSIWSPRVVDQVKASLRRINLHSSHSKDRLHLRPLVYRREKTPSRATVMQVNSMNNRNRDSKDRKAMIRPKRSNLEPIDIRGRRVNTADKLHSSSIIRNQVSISTFRVDFHTETD